MASIIKAMACPGNRTQRVLAFAIHAVFAVGALAGLAAPVCAQTQAGSSGQVAPAPSAVATPAGNAPPGSAQSAQPAGAAQSAQPAGSTSQAAGTGGAEIAQFTAGILASMNGGPRIWQSPDAVIPDFNAVNAAIEQASASDVRVAIWGPADAMVNAEDVAASLGQSLGGTVITISPASVGVYSATLDDERVDQAMAGIAAQLGAEQNPATIITLVTGALTAQPATTTSGLLRPALVGLAILIVGGGAWFVMNRGRTPGTSGSTMSAGPTPSARTSAARGKGESWGVRLNRFLAGRQPQDEPSSPQAEDEADGDDYVVDQPVRRIAAEVIDIESDAPRPEEVSRSAVGAQTTASSFGKVAAKSQLDQIAQRIVTVSDQVVRTQDMALMAAFEQVAGAYTEAKADLDQATRPVDVINVNDRLRSISDQLALLERRIEP